MLAALAAWLRGGRAGPLVLALLHALALAVFVHGFLLMRVHLDDRSTAAPALPSPRTKLVWLMIDSLRYDFVVADGRYSCVPGRVCHQGRMPFLANLTTGGGALAFRFVADPPTTTTQRLNSLMTGGLPSFFDVSNSFSAGHVVEDNLVDQLRAAGRTLAFLGDATWAQLFPTQFAITSAFPCFNIKDLHTVDDGVWERLLPLLRQGGSWDVLVAHYLGVDHAGHAHGVGSEEMAAKLAQMDSHVQQVAEQMVQGSSPGGEFERALLLVSGDHGQTLSGDHGGGSPEEVDSALVVIDPAALRSLGQLEGHSGGGSSARGWSAQRGALWGPAACRRNCSCGPDANQCAADLAQMDLTSTLAALLGVAIPFGNLGKVSPELWGFAAVDDDGSEESEQGAAAASDERLAAVLHANAEQVHTYLNAYASKPGSAFSSAALREINHLYADLTAAAATNNSAAAAAQNSRSLVFLEAAAALAREQWTQFGDLSMLAGLLLFAAVLGIHAAAAFGWGHKTSSGNATHSATGSNGGHSTLSSWATRAGAQLAYAGFIWRPPGTRWPLPTVGGAMSVLVAIHVLGIFSFFFLLSEGSKLCYLVGAMTVVLAAAASKRPSLRVALLALLTLACNAVMASWGLTSHSGLAFWHRLTVHPQETADLAAPDSQQAAAAAAAAGAGLVGQLLSLARAWQGLGEPWAAAGRVLLCLLPIAALASVALHTLGRYPGGSRLLLSLRRWLLAAAFASVAVYHSLDQLTHLGVMGDRDASASALVQRGQHALSSSKQLAWATPLLTAGEAALAQGPMLQLAALPLRLLLPRLTYSLCGASLLAWAVQQAHRRLGQGNGETSNGPLQQLAGLAEGVAGLQGPLLALTLQVSDVRMPMLLLLAAAQLWAGAQLLLERGRRLQRSDGTAAAVGMEAAALLATTQAQVFFATGHLCEFAGLQYLAGFVGYDDFNLARGAALISIQTFGAMMLVALALPSTLHTLAGAETEAELASSAPAQRQGQASPLQQQRKQLRDGGGGWWRRALLVFLLVRAATTFAATVGAAVQRRHLYAWALFAPKFAFELVFLLSTDLLLGLACLLL